MKISRGWMLLGVVLALLGAGRLFAEVPVAIRNFVPQGRLDAAENPARTVEANQEACSPLPARGAASSQLAKSWEEAFVSGNGHMGAMVFGQPIHETIVANHCRLFLSLGTREIVPDMAQYLPEVRRLICEKGYGQAYKFMLDRAKEQGFPGLSWTDPFHPGFELKIEMPSKGAVKDYLRTEDFQTGEVTVRWSDDQGKFRRRLFISRPDNVIALSITGPAAGELNCDLFMVPISHKLIDSVIKTEKEWITCHNVYVKGKGGYDGAVRIETKGGQALSDGRKITVSGADEVLALMRIDPYKKLEDSSVRCTKADLAELPADYHALFQPHARAHGEIFNRVALDLGGGADRDLPTEVLLDRAAKEGRPPMALLEKMYDAGRYMFICASGELAPNLQGIWTGTWRPAWSGDFTLDTNLQAAVGSGLSANMLECMEGYFRLIESFVPDCRENATKIYGCRGILTNSRASNNCLLLHWGNGWPGQFWTAGAGWLTHWFYHYYLYTGDKEFLAKRAVPLLKEAALFYEDFLFVDETSKYRFSPSFSPETEMGDNSTMDIAVAKEVLTNLIAACEELKIEQENVPKWRAMLAKMPPYRINEQGELSEWGLPGHREHYGHRHHSHLYPVFQSHELTPEQTPGLWKAAQAAVLKKINSNGEQSSFGRMQAGLSAAYLRMGEEAYGRLAIMAVRKSMYTSLITSHEPNQRIFNVDGNGSIHELVNNMLLFSWPGKLDLLPALPQAWPRGSIRGILARGQIRIDRLEWDKPAGRILLELTSKINQTVAVRLPNSKNIKSIRVTRGAAEVKESARGANCRELTLSARETVATELTF